jgi:hypothetical protein
MGRLRGKVFPACFALNAACTAASAAAFAWLHRPPWPPAERRQLAVLLVAAGYDLANLLIFTPRTLEVHSFQIEDINFRAKYICDMRYLNLYGYII